MTGMTTFLMRRTIFLRNKNISKNNITFYIGELDPSSSKKLSFLSFTIQKGRKAQ